MKNLGDVCTSQTKDFLEVTNVAPTDAFEEVEEEHIFVTVSSTCKWVSSIFVIITCFTTFGVLIEGLSSQPTIFTEISDTFFPGCIMAIFFLIPLAL